MLVFNNYFCKNRKSKLHSRDRVAVINVFLYQTGASITEVFFKFECRINFFIILLLQFGRHQTLREDRHLVDMIVVRPCDRYDKVFFVLRIVTDKVEQDYLLSPGLHMSE
jgi:hypothetical protein